MSSMRGKSSFYSFLLSFGLLCTVNGFTLNSHTFKCARSSTTLAADIQNECNGDDSLVSRRALGIQASAAMLATIGLNSQVAIADEGKEGRLIEFTVENLNGEVGNSGKFIMKTNPEWAPNGVERFEKLTEVGFWNDVRIFRVLPNFIVSLFFS